MKKKKITFKTIMLIVFLLVFILLVVGTCKKKVSAYSNCFYDVRYNISEREQGQLGISFLINFTPKESGSYLVGSLTSPDATDYLQIYYDYLSGLSGTITINYFDGEAYYTIDNATIYTPLVLVILKVYNNELYLTVDYLELESITSITPPEVDSSSYTRAYILNIEDYGLSSDYYDTYLSWRFSSSPRQVVGLLQAYYLEASDSYNTIYNLYSNSINYNYYSYFMGQGYDIGYDIGYDAGEDAGEDAGYNVGYNVGYIDGQNAENATPLIFAVLQGVFETLGAFLSIEILPHIPIGLFFALPLFFAVVGLILWIWRRH